MLPVETQRFLQMLASEGIMSDDEVRRQASTIFGEECSQNQITIINRKLKRYNFTIKSALCELTGQKYWIFTSDAIDKNMNFRGQFTEAQLELIRKIFSEIIDTDDGHLSSIACMNMSSTLTGHLSPLQAESLLHVLVEQKWLSMKEGRVYMGVRSIGELMPYFKETYADNFHICLMCKCAVFYGNRCENCQTLSHLYCLARVAKFNKNLKCLNCKTNMVVEDLPQVTSEDSMEVDDDIENTQTTQKSRRGNTRETNVKEEHSKKAKKHQK